MNKGWKNMKLKDISTISSGNPAPQDKNIFNNGDIPFIRTSDVGKIKIGKISNSLDKINIDNIGTLKLKLFKKGTILIPKSGASTFLNHRTLMDVDAYVSSHLATAKANNNLILDSFLFYFLINIKAQDLIPDNSYPSLNLKIIENIDIKMPSLDIQKSIVEKLDTCMEQIDKAIQNVEQNIQNAEELFQSQLNEIFNQKGDGWTDCNLKDVCKFDKIKNKRLDLPYVGLEHIESNTGNFIGSLDSRQVKSSTFHFNSKHILYGRLRPYLNKVLIPDFEGHCSSEIFPILVNDSIKREFLFFWLISSDTVKKINATCTGARMPRANMNELIKLNFSFPSIDKQEALVQKLNRLNKECNTLHNNYIKELDAIDDLKQSILEKAFNGEL